jgi:hypothetical protein
MQNDHPPNPQFADRVVHIRRPLQRKHQGPGRGRDHQPCALLDPGAGPDLQSHQETGMTITLHALPYDICASGFYFHNIEDYQSLAAKAVNACGHPVEEFEIQFIDGNSIDVELARAFELNQSNVSVYLKAVAEWSDNQKIRFIIAAGECGHSFDPSSGSVDDIDIDMYEIGSLRELAEQFIDEGLFGEIPKHLETYIDLDAIARDLAADYAEKSIGGKNFVFRIP